MPIAIIAEDEPLLREQLRQHLGALWPELTIADEVEDGIQALASLERHAPEILFLDVRMPGLSGLDVARQAGGRCHVVFVTAYDEHAIAAFESGAVDYVLKPIQPARLATTIARLKQRLLAPPADLQSLLGRLASGKPKEFLRWIQASSGNKLRFITVDEVIAFQADAKYTMVLTRDYEALIKKPIKELAEELDPAQFWQVHRSTIISTKAIEFVHRGDDGRMDVQLAGRKERFTVSKSYYHLFKQM